jgi:predicted LPLAT superfamily acyltransferase
MTEMAPQAGVNLMPVTDIGPDTYRYQREAGAR